MTLRVNTTTTTDITKTGSADTAPTSRGERGKPDYVKLGQLPLPTLETTGKTVRGDASDVDEDEASEESDDDEENTLSDPDDGREQEE